LKAYFNMNVLITGASGFIGRAVTKKLDCRGIQWTPFTGNILRPGDFQNQKHCDVLLHLAGMNRTGLSYEEQKHLMDVNITGTLNAIDFARAGGSRFLFPSTCSYGNPDTFPISESAPMTYHDPYSYSKWHAEQTISAWHKLFGLEGVIFRIFNAYGPDQPRQFLIPDIVHMIKKRRLRLFNLTSIRDFIYVDDLAELITRTTTTTVPGLITVNAGSGTGHSVKDVVNIFFDLLGRKLPIEDEGHPPFIKKSIADVQCAEKLFGWRHNTSLRDGVASVLQRHGLLPYDIKETKCTVE